MVAYHPLEKMLATMRELERSSAEFNKITRDIESHRVTKLQLLMEDSPITKLKRDIERSSAAFTTLQAIIENSAIAKMKSAIGSKLHSPFDEMIRDNSSDQCEDQVANSDEESEVHPKLLFLDSTYQFFNSELVATIILWIFLSENNLFEQCTRDFIKSKVCNYFSEFKNEGKGKALKRIITMVRSGNARGRKMKRSLSIFIDSKEKIIDKLSNVIKENLTPLFMQSAHKFHSFELMATFTLFRHLEENNLFGKCTVTFLTNKLYDLFPIYYSIEKQKERERIITILRAGKGLPYRK